LTDSFLDPLEIKPDLTPLDFSILPAKVISRLDYEVHLPLSTDGIYHGSFDYTDSLFTELFSRGYIEGRDIFTFPYDWRFGAEANVNALKNRIQQILDQTHASKVDIIAHSTNDNHKIGKAIFVAVPNLGAPKAVNVLLTGDTGMNKLGLVGLAFTEMKKLAMNMPVVYDLSPSMSYFLSKGSFVQIRTPAGLFSTTIQNLDYAQTREFLINERGANSLAFGKAVNLHGQDFDNFDLRTKGIDLYNIVGCGSGTIGQVIEQRYLVGNSTYSVVHTPGDGTVPIEKC
jgi:hypothetical protein